jgi:VIT1/CCC1 family predicted Fe2+/Mn2+ transporter
MKAQKDTLIYVIVITGLSLSVVASMMGIITLTITGLIIQQLLIALGSAAIGGLAGSLARSCVR